MDHIPKRVAAQLIAGLRAGTTEKVGIDEVRRALLGDPDYPESPDEWTKKYLEEKTLRVLITQVG